VIDRSKFSKEFDDRSNLKAITVTVQILGKLRSINLQFQMNCAIDRLSFC
jgi:hypothetical protein